MCVCVMVGVCMCDGGCDQVCMCRGGLYDPVHSSAAIFQPCISCNVAGSHRSIKGPIRRFFGSLVGQFTWN